MYCRAKVILAIFIKAVAELGVILYTLLYLVNFLLAIKLKNYIRIS